MDHLVTLKRSCLGGRKATEITSPSFGLHPSTFQPPTQGLLGELDKLVQLFKLQCRGHREKVKAFASGDFRNSNFHYVQCTTIKFVLKEQFKEFELFSEYKKSFIHEILSTYISRIFLGYLQDISRIFLGYFQDISRIFLGYFQDLSRIFLGYF